MAVQFQLDHMNFEVWNVYAPTNGVDRENLFSRLAELQASENSVLIVGGDFNCTQWPMMDRSNQATAARHISKSLTQLLERRGLVDALIQDQDRWTQPETKEFRAKHHTYYYRQQDGSIESSRLDRWYLENTVYSWCREVQREIPTGSSDHDGVRLHLQSMSDPRKMKRISKLHPMPGYAVQQVNEFSLKAIEEFAADLVTVSSTETSAERWDTFKRHLLRDGLRVKRQARRRITGTLRQKERRLKKRIGRLERLIHSISPTVESITETLEDLSLEHDEDEQNIESLRCALRAIQERRQQFRTAKVYESHVQRSQKQSKHFFDRVSTKYTDNYMPLLKQTNSQQQRPPGAKAEIVADAWEPIMSGPLTDPQVGEDFLADITRPSVADGFFDELEAPITVAEVTAAINHLSDGKSPGPDRIPNGWYKMHRDRISPLLASLFTRWHRDCIFPSSFNEAEIFCLKKNGIGSDPMNYRPLALLNSDYKIYTRILATRLRKLLGVLVHPSQNGFVADRSIHDTIDMLLAAIKAAHQDPQLKRALAILMDFRKAYDTLDRGFLLKTLRHHRIPDQFVRVVEALHAKTVVRFLANGERSRPVRVRCGIRQGCPLAPLLFILALDPLYRALERAAPQLGIRLRWKTQHVTQVASGFADDTTGYVPGPEALPLFLRITDDFGRASGLRLNREKTTILSLSGSITAHEVDAQGLSLLSLTETCRYLGIQIGSGGASEKSWEIAEHQLRTRLILAGDKTHTVDQRGVIASSVIIPKLLYIARHSWPSATTVRHFSRLIQSFVFHGTFTSSFPNRRAWLSLHHGAEPREVGGLAFPDLRCELLALSAQVVDHWATTGDAVRQLVVDILVSTINQKRDRKLCVMYGTTSAQQLPIRIKKTLWSTGSSVLKIWAARPTSTEIGINIVSVMNQLADLDTCQFQWSLNGVLFEVTEALVITRSLQHSYRRLLGNFCSEWLLHVSWDELQWYSTAGPVNDIRAEFPSWIRANDPIGSTIRWEWEAPGRVRWWPKRTRRHMTRPVTAQFERLILMLVAHFPALLRRQYHHDFLRVETTPSPPPADFKLSIRSHTQPGEGEGVSIALTNVTAMSVNCQVQNALGRTYTVTYIHFHPRLHRAAVLWTKGNRYRPRRASLRSCIRNHSRQSTPSLPVRAAQGWARDNIEIGEAVSKVAWASIWKIDGASNADMLLFYRIKSRTLPLWVTSLDSQSCGALSCNHASTTLSHVFIHCPKAQLLWAEFLQRWTRCGVHLGQNEHVNLLNLTLPPISPTFWIQYDQEAKLQDEDGDQWLRNALHANWRLGILLTLRVIWIWRNDRCHQAEQRSDRHYTAMLEKRLTQGAHFLERTAPIDAKYPEATKYFCYVRTALQSSTNHQNEPLCTGSGVEYLAFFDGGSRGNPGAGGAGAVILRIGGGGTQPHIIWVATIPLSEPTTTNNIAEFRGLQATLRHALRNRLSPIHIVGDSAVVLAHLRDRRPPHSRHLRIAYGRCAHLADRLQVLSWTHHRRAYNKMADALANFAMDNPNSQPEETHARYPHTARWRIAHDLLQGDWTQWILGRALVEHGR